MCLVGRIGTSVLSTNEGYQLLLILFFRWNLVRGGTDSRLSGLPFRCERRDLVKDCPGAVLAAGIVDYRTQLLVALWIETHLRLLFLLPALLLALLHSSLLLGHLAINLLKLGISGRKLLKLSLVIVNLLLTPFEIFFVFLRLAPTSV